MKVYLEAIGCRLNQAEIDRYAAQLCAQGHTITLDVSEADWVVVNTCSVTAAAASDSRNRIRTAARNSNAKIVVTGCWSELDADGAARLPNVVSVVPNAEKDTLVGRIPAATHEIVGALVPVHARGRTRSFLKVQDGCDNFCSFCVTRLARGKARSIGVERVLREIRAVETSGGHEVVLTGVNLGAWGLDFNPIRTLTDLLKIILSETTIERVRLSSLENWNLDLDFVALWENPRLLPHFHLPLQSGSPTVLKRMVRRTKPADFLALIHAARSLNPHFSITTDLIVGFPGESEAEFDETLAFVESANFSGGHVFSFSPRPGTAAVKLPGAVPAAVKKERSALLRGMLAGQQARFLAAQVGETRSVLWEHGVATNDGRVRMKGLTENYLPIVKIVDRDCSNEVTQETVVSVENGKVLRC